METGEGPGTPPFRFVLEIQNSTERFFSFPSPTVSDWFKLTGEGLGWLFLACLLKQCILDFGPNGQKRFDDIEVRGPDFQYETGFLRLGTMMTSDDRFTRLKEYSGK